MNTDVDRISNLPDSVLCHILSFLPTRTSVTTSILSPRWRHLWQHLDVFHIDERHFKGYRLGSVTIPFPRFMNSILALRKVRDIKKFSLSCRLNYIDRYDVMMWVRAAIGPHLQELNLDLFSLDFFQTYPAYGISCGTIFSCSALVSLNLHGGISFGPFVSVHLPSLKNLTLRGTYPIDVLLSGCPVLETLDFDGALSTHSCCIISSSLKTLKFYAQKDEIVKSIEIHTPSLELIRITIVDGCGQFSLCYLFHLVDAHLDFSYEGENVDFATELLMKLHITKNLSLGYSFTKILLGNRSILNFPKFWCLLQLTINTSCFYYDLFVDLLRNCKVLQVLQINNKDGYYLSNDSSWDLLDCSQQTHVPTCVLSHLTTVRFQYFYNYEDERAFVAYILQGGLVLKTLEIITINLEDAKNYIILKYLSEIPRGSNLCQVMFNKHP